MVSNRFAVAFQLGLSLAVAGAATLSLGWDNPKWALLAVAFCVLGTGGESLMKGTWRLLGTVIGVIVALTFLALFVQDRWSYMVATMLWLGFCSWMSTGHRNWYVWMLAGFLVPLMGYYSQGNPERAFQDVMLRLQQTSLGVLSFTLVSSFFFPRHAADRFIDNVIAEIEDIGSRVTKLSQNYGTNTPDQMVEPEWLKRQAQTLQSQVQKADTLDAAAFENVGILQDRARWVCLLDGVRILDDGLTRWYLGFADLEGIPDSELPQIETVTVEITRRLENTVALLRDDTTTYRLEPVEVTMPENLPADPFQEGAIRLSLQTLHDLERASAKVLNAAADIKNLSHTPYQPPDSVTGLPTSIIPDPDRLAAALRLMCAFMTAFLVVIFTPELPSAGMVAILICSSGSFVTRLPATPVPPVYLAGLLAVFSSGLLHIFIMPKLSSYLELGVMFFVYAFMVGYIFHKPTQIVPRFFGVGFMTLVIQLDNLNQTYSFTYVVNFAIAFCFPMFILHCLTRFPISFRPERVFDRMFRRYIRSAIALIDTYEQHFSKERTWWQQQKHAFHLRELRRLPGLMEPWIAGLEAGITEGDKDKTLRDLLNALDALAHRLDHLTQPHDWTPNDPLVNVLAPELNAWRQSVKDSAQKMITTPLLIDPDALAERLSTRIDRLREITDAAIIKTGESIKDPAILGHVAELAVFRGVSRALLNIARPAREINWARLRETRF